MQNSGKLLILAMLAVGLVSGGVSWWFRYSATHRAAEFWGAETARLIRDAPHVELLWLRRVEEGADRGEEDAYLFAGGARWEVADRHDVSRAPGLTHLRNALADDRSYDWSQRAIGDKTGEIEWRYGLRFMAEGGEGDEAAADEAVVLVSAEFNWITHGRLANGEGAESGVTTGTADTSAVATKPIAGGLEEVVHEWMGEMRNEH